MPARNHIAVIRRAMAVFEAFACYEGSAALCRKWQMDAIWYGEAHG
jgi:hypothetical protein